MSGSGRVDNGLWQPRSDCGPGCLPVPGESEVLPRNRQAGRLLGMLGVALLGVGLLPVLPVLNARGRHLAGRAWARTVLRVLGIRLVARGRLPQRRALLAANHISWLDIVAILAVSPSRMLAKHDVRGWPLFGALAAAAGTIFVDRTRPRQLPATVAQVATALRADGVVTVFPEGTTWCGAPRGSADCGGSGRFRPAMFQAAVDAGAVVVPLTISYRTGLDREGATAAAFLGDETLWVSLRRVLAVRELVVSVTAAPALHPAAGADRRVLARVAESAVRMPWCGCQSRFVACRAVCRGGLAMYRVIVGGTSRGRVRHARMDHRRAAAAHPDRAGGPVGRLPALRPAQCRRS